MKKLFTIYTLFAIALATLKVNAQSDTLRTDVIDVIKPFRAILSESIKIPSNPNPEIPDIKPVTLTYNLPEVRHNDVPTIYTIKPLSLGTSLLPKLKNNYTRLGYGNYNTPLFEVYLNSTRNRSAQWGAFYKHLSSSDGNLRTFSNNTLGLYGKKFIDKGIVESDLLYHRNLVHLYGYSDAATLPSKNDLRNQFNLLDVHGAYANVLKDTSKLGYKIGMRYYAYTTNNQLNEGDFKLYANFSKSMSGNPLKVFTQVQLNNTGYENLNYNRVFVDINPEYLLNISTGFYVSLGFNSTYFSDTATNKLYFYPKAEAGIGIIKNGLTFFTGITGNLQRNTLRSITTENPFVRSFALYNTENQFEAYAGLKGIVSPQTSFLLQASYATVRNLMFYGADTITYAQNTVFDLNASGLTQIKAELNHDFWKSFRLGANINYFGYDLTLNAPYSRPTFTSTVHLTYNMADKFILKTEAFTMNERVALLRGTNGNNTEVKIDGWVDWNAGLEYRYSKTVGLFINVNNLTNNQYQRWLNLPVYGINILGGLAVTF